MRAVVKTLARGWRRGSKRWYLGTALVLGLSITMLLVVSGLFAGMQSETQERVADFYAADVRITPQGLGAIPPGRFFDLDEARQQVYEGGSTAIVHLESQAVLSRRGFLETVTGEPDQVQVGSPGSETDGDEVIALGALIGIESRSEAVAPIKKHLVAGQVPTNGRGEGSIPLLMSLIRLDQFLTVEERAELSSWPPPMSEIKALSFEITAAKVVQDEEGNNQDVIRRPAHIVGLYDSGVDLLDGLTYVAPIEDVRQLLGHEPTDKVANVILAKGNPDNAHKVADRNGWTSQSAATFTDRYLGQLIDVLQGLSIIMTIFLFMLPAFLIVHGVGRQLETHNREIAVCAAIGVRRQTVRQALSWVVVQVAVAATAMAAVLTTIIGLILHWVLPGQRGVPVPMDFHATFLSIFLALVITMGSVAIALWIAFRSQAKQPLATVLRTF